MKSPVATIVFHFALSPPLLEAWIEIMRDRIIELQLDRRLLCWRRGLKYMSYFISLRSIQSPPLLEAWIEILYNVKIKPL